MKIIGYTKVLSEAGEDHFVRSETEIGVPGEHDLLVEVKAISVNPVDIKMRKKTDPNSEVIVLGWDASGIVSKIGSKVSLFKVGDEVFYAGAIDRPGTNSQFHLVDERIVGIKPKKLNYAEAAALPLTSITAWEGLFDRLSLKADDSNVLLVMGGAGGVGSMVIQLAKALTNLTVVATASREKSKEWCYKMGADYVINHHHPIKQQLDDLKISDPDFVFSTTKTEENFNEISEVIAPEGKLLIIDDPKNIDISILKKKSISLCWEFMFTRSLFKNNIIKQHIILNKVSSLIDSGKIKTSLNERFSPINAENLIKAHKNIETDKTIGKIVIEGW